MVIPEVRVSNTSSDTVANNPGIDKGFWEWITGLVGNIPAFGNQDTTSTTTSPDVGPAQFPKDCQTCSGYLRDWLKTLTFDHKIDLINLRIDRMWLDEQKHPYRRRNGNPRESVPVDGSAVVSRQILLRWYGNFFSSYLDRSSLCRRVSESIDDWLLKMMTILLHWFQVQ